MRKLFELSKGCTNEQDKVNLGYSIVEVLNKFEYNVTDMIAKTGGDGIETRFNAVMQDGGDHIASIDLVVGESYAINIDSREKAAIDTIKHTISEFNEQYRHLSAVNPYIHQDNLYMMVIKDFIDFVVGQEISSTEYTLELKEYNFNDEEQTEYIIHFKTKFESVYDINFVIDHTETSKDYENDELKKGYVYIDPKKSLVDIFDKINHILINIPYEN